jgi:hypothetical protein
MDIAGRGRDKIELPYTFAIRSLKRNESIMFTNLYVYELIGVLPLSCWSFSEDLYSSLVFSSNNLITVD